MPNYNLEELGNWERPLINAVLRTPRVSIGQPDGSVNFVDPLSVVAVIAIAVRVADPKDDSKKAIIAKYSNEDRLALATTAEIIKNNPDMVKAMLGPNAATLPEFRPEHMDKLKDVLTGGQSLEEFRLSVESKNG